METLLGCMTRLLEFQFKMITKKEKRKNLEEKIANNRMKLLGIMLSPKVELTEKEQEHYQEFKDNKFCDYKSEKDYLIKRLKIEIGLQNLNRVGLICDEKGHVEKSSHVGSGPGGTRAYATCKRCKMMYDRGLTSKESEDFVKLMRTPFTI